MSNNIKKEMLEKVKYKNISHFNNWLENTKDIEIQKYNANLKKNGFKMKNIQKDK